MRVVITGAGGRLGTVVTRHLAPFHDVLPTDIRPGDGVQQLDIRDRSALLKVCRDGQALIHLAGLDYDTPSDLRETLETNVIGTASVLEVCNQVGMEKVVICSSVAAVGLHERRSDWLPESLPITENHEQRPVEDYSVSKAMVELLACAAAESLHSLLCIRPVAIVFPSHEEAFADSMLHGDHSLRDFIAAEDVAEAIGNYLDMRHVGYDCVTLAANDAVTDQPTLQWFCQTFPAFDGAINQQYFENRPFAGLYSNDRAKELLNWEPQVTRSVLWSRLGRPQMSKGMT